MQYRDLDVAQISRAFSPAKEISDPWRFAGRREEIRSALTALHNPGGFLVIHGLRGVGKTSVALQIKNIAEGSTQLPKMMALTKLMPNKPFNYIVHYYKSDGFIKDIGDLFKRMLFGDDANPSLFSLTKAGDKMLKEYHKTVKLEGGINLHAAKFGGSGSEEKVFTNRVSDDLTQQFRKLLGTIQKDNHSRTGLLILVDEFDTIQNKDGFSSIVKACSSDFVRFGIIGIASSVTELVRDHSSVGRQIDSVQIPTMSTLELADILKKAEYFVDQLITFDQDAISAITEQSEGFPFFTHLLGKEAMISAFERSSTKITSHDIELVSKRISEGRLNCIYEDIYHGAVRSSPQREILLKIFSEQSEDQIHTETVYALARDMDISNPSQLMKQLTSPDSSHQIPVLIKIREKCFRFSDPVFKTYARLRNWKFN